MLQLIFRLRICGQIFYSWYSWLDVPPNSQNKYWKTFASISVENLHLDHSYPVHFAVRPRISSNQNSFVSRRCLHRGLQARSWISYACQYMVWPSTFRVLPGQAHRGGQDRCSLGSTARPAINTWRDMCWSRAVSVFPFSFHESSFVYYKMISC